MLDTILSILRRSDLAGWEVSSVTTEGWEFYFIRHALDQNRAKKVEHITVRVYCLLDDGAAIGSASCEGDCSSTVRNVPTRNCSAMPAPRSAIAAEGTAGDPE